MTQNIYEILRRYEFNKTEPETLVGLVEEAIDKGEDAQAEQARLRQASAALLDLFQNASWIAGLELEDEDSLLAKCTVGIDGSHQPVGGVGGKWYVPMSCAVIRFEQGISSTPGVDVETHIVEIQELESPRVRSRASEIMLSIETKAIQQWAMQNKPSLLFIDGPIVDPPTCETEEYLDRRCAAIKECLKRGVTVIGCAKRVRDVSLRKFAMTEAANDVASIDRLNIFPSDLQLVAFVFGHRWRSSNANGMKGLYSVPLDVTELGSEGDIYKLYLERSLHIFSTYVQKTVDAYILRLDIPFLTGQMTDEAERAQQIQRAIGATFAWTYPKHSIPLPVFLAHNKCEVRKGCAEVLYLEIMTRSRSTDPLDQIVTLQLEARL
jgi:hypothetical protein